MATLELRAPAKLNLGLRLVGRRADGYHELEGLFLPLEFADVLHIDLDAEPGGIELELLGDVEAIPAGQENLAWRAARLFREASGLGGRVSLRLRKRIPSGAGLGGGSSDAGAVLRGLERLAATATDLLPLALALGADVPFFLDPQPAWVTGIGERIEPVAGLSSVPVVVALPEGRISTAAAFAAWDASGAALTPRSPASTIQELLPLRRLLAHPERSSAGEWAEALHNDLEPTAASLCPGVTGLGRRMRELGAVAAGMSGSGPAIFGVFGSEQEAARAEGVLSSEGCERVFRTRTMGSS